MKKFSLISILLFSSINAAYAEENLFECTTEKHTILITQDEAKTYHYRSWNLPKKISEKPDVDIKKGTSTYEGTGVCGYHLFKFKSGKVKYSVMDNAKCAAGGAPKNAVGSVNVEINDKNQGTYWCIHDRTKDADYIKLQNAVTKECQEMRLAARNPIKSAHQDEETLLTDIDINNDGKIDKVYEHSGGSNFFSGRYLFAFVDADKKKINEFVSRVRKLEEKKDMPFAVDDKVGVKFNQDYGAYVISLGQAESSIARYVFNTPFYYEGKTYIIATESNADKFPPQSISIITSDNKAKLLCKFADVDSVVREYW